MFSFEPLLSMVSELLPMLLFERKFEQPYARSCYLCCPNNNRRPVVVVVVVEAAEIIPLPVLVLLFEL